VPHSYSGEVLCVARAIVGRLIVGREEPRQGRPWGDTLCRKVVERQEWCFVKDRYGEPERGGVNGSR
jgi:hypothetical protein